MKKYSPITKTRKTLMTGLTAIILLIPGCQTFEPGIYEPDNYDPKGVYVVDNNAQEHAAREESLQGRDTLVYPRIFKY